MLAAVVLADVVVVVVGVVDYEQISRWAVELADYQM